MKYTVVIPSYNSKETIGSCLESIFNSLKRSSIDVEIFVVDSSNDGTSDFVRKIFPQVNLIRFDKQTYQSRARNVGARQGRGEYIVFIDSDCVVSEDYFKNLDEIVKKYGDEYGGFGGKTLNGTPESVVGSVMYFLQFRDFLWDEEVEVKNIPSTNIIYKRDLFLKEGGFNEELASSEETLFNLNFSKKYGLFFSPSIYVYHLNRKNLRSFLLHQIKNGYNFQKFKTLFNYGGKLSNTPILIPLFPIYRFLRSVKVIFKVISPIKLIPFSILLFLGLIFYSLGEISFFFKGDGDDINRL